MPSLAENPTEIAFLTLILAKDGGRDQAVERLLEMSPEEIEDALEDGHQLRESAPVRTLAIEHGNLIERQVTVHRADGTTFQRKQMVSGSGASPGATEIHQAEHPPTADHALDGFADKIAAIDPATARRPGLMHRLGEAAIGAAARVNLFLLRHHDRFEQLQSILGAYFDTPADLQKLGYHPSVSSGTASGAAALSGDPMRGLTADLPTGGISTHLACTVASHALAKGYLWAKRKVKGKATEEAGDVLDLAAELLADVLEHVNAMLGLEGVPTVAAIRAGLGGKPAARESAPVADVPTPPAIPGRTAHGIEQAQALLRPETHQSLARAMDKVQRAGFDVPAFDTVVGTKDFQDRHGKNWHNVPASIKSEGDQKTLLVNPAYFSLHNQGQKARENFRSGYSSTDDPDHVFLHEMGHALHDVPSLGEGTDGEQGRFSPAQKEIALRVSRRAGHSPAEFVAETFAGRVRGNAYPNDVTALYHDFGGPTPTRPPSPAREEAPESGQAAVGSGQLKPEEKTASASSSLSTAQPPTPTIPPPDWEHFPSSRSQNRYRNRFTGAVSYAKKIPRGRSDAERIQEDQDRTKALAYPARVVTIMPEQKKAMDDWEASTGLKPEHVAQLVGGQPGTKIRPYLSTYAPTRTSLTATLDHPDATDWGRTIQHDTPTGKLLLSNNQMFLRPRAQKGGFAMQAFANQVRAAVEHGVSAIHTTAGKGTMHGQPMVGYHVWPNVGYDTPLGSDHLRKIKKDPNLPPEVKAAKTVLDLYKTPEGKAWWQKHGTMESMKFDVSPGSPSMNQLNSYLRSKGQPEIEYTPEMHAANQEKAKQRVAAYQKMLDDKKAANVAASDRAEDPLDEVHARHAQIAADAGLDPNALRLAATHQANRVRQQLETNNQPAVRPEDLLSSAHSRVRHEAAIGRLAERIRHPEVSAIWRENAKAAGIDFDELAKRAAAIGENDNGILLSPNGYHAASNAYRQAFDSLRREQRARRNREGKESGG